MQKHKGLFDYPARCGRAPPVSGNTQGFAATISVLLHAIAILPLSLSLSFPPASRAISISLEHVPPRRGLASAPVRSFRSAVGTMRADGKAGPVRRPASMHPSPSFADSPPLPGRRSASAKLEGNTEKGKLERVSKFSAPDFTDGIEPGVPRETDLSGTERTMGFAEEHEREPPAPSVVRSTDLHGYPGEEVEYVHSPSDGSVKVTMREAYGSIGANRSASIETGDEDAVPGFSGPSDDSALARSQRFDWKIFDRGNLGISAFGYQNEIGREFRPFGKFKKEFATANSSTTKGGGNVRLGPLKIGFTQSATGKAEPSIEYGDNLPRVTATQQEVNATLDLQKLLPDFQDLTGMPSELVPSLWVSQSYNHPSSRPGSADLDTVSTAFGGSWSWNSGQATLGYWSYASDRPPDHAGSAWNGEGLDASLGFYHATLGVDLNFSYGHMEDVAGSWLSVSALYDSSITLSYSGESLPPVWATAALGNFNSNSLFGTA